MAHGVLDLHQVGRALHHHSAWNSIVVAEFGGEYDGHLFAKTLGPSATSANLAREPFVAKEQLNSTAAASLVHGQVRVVRS